MGSLLTALAILALLCGLASLLRAAWLELCRRRLEENEVLKRILDELEDHSDAPQD